MEKNQPVRSNAICLVLKLDPVREFAVLVSDTLSLFARIS
jgi:hypothetical protein